MFRKVWLSQPVRRLSLSQGRLTEHGRERSWPGCRVASQPSPCAGPPYLFVLVLSIQEHRERALYILFSHPSAPRQDLREPLLLLVLSPGKNVPLLPEQCYLTPYSVLPGLWRSRVPGRGTQKEILVLKNTEQNCCRPLFLKQTCLLWWCFSVLTV